MSNLLLEEKRKSIFNEMLVRLVIVFLVLVFVSLCFAVILLIPSYIISQVRESNVSEEIKDFKKTIDFMEQSLPTELMARDKKKIEVLAGSTSEILFTETLSSLLKETSKDIKIDEILYEKVSRKTGDKQEMVVQMVVRGVAEKRSSLIDFVNKIKKDEHFSEVDFPVSNLVEDQSIKFSLRIFVK